MQTFRADCRMCTFCTVIFLSSFPLKKNVFSKFTSTTILLNLYNIIIICAACNKIIDVDIVIFGRHSYRYVVARLRAVRYCLFKRVVVLLQRIILYHIVYTIYLYYSTIKIMSTYEWFGRKDFFIVWLDSVLKWNPIFFSLNYEFAVLFVLRHAATFLLQFFFRYFSLYNIF